MSDYNCIMIGYGPIKEIENIQDNIDVNDVYNGEDNNDNTYGIEKEPHVTLLYGLATNVTWDDVKEYLLPLNEYSTILYNLSLFENEKFDVLKMDVKSPKMDETNKALRDNLPHDELYPNYHPHLTVAYLKPGKGKKYVKQMLHKIIELTPKEYLYSYGENGKYEKEKYTKL